jgi:hypothetical protein
VVLVWMRVSEKVQTLCMRNGDIGEQDGCLTAWGRS